MLAGSQAIRILNLLHKINMHIREPPIKLILQTSNDPIQLLNLLPQRLHLILGPYIRLGCALDTNQELRPTPLKTLVIKADVARCPGIVVCRQYGLSLEFPKTVEIELPCERAKVGMLKVFGKDSGGEFFNVLDNETVPVVGPGGKFLIAVFNHLIGFSEKHWQLGMLGDAAGSRGFLFFVSSNRKGRSVHHRLGDVGSWSWSCRYTCGGNGSLVVG